MMDSCRFTRRPRLPALLAALSLLTPLVGQESHLGRVVMQQDVIPAAVSGNNAFSYPCIAQGQGGSGYSYVCNPPSCVLPEGFAISSQGVISVADPSKVAPGVKKVTLTLQATEGTIQQDVLVEVLRADSTGANWCPRGTFGGSVSAVALAPDFVTSSTAMAGGENGGLVVSSDAGLTWSPVPKFGPVPVQALAADGCATPMTVWAVTGSAGSAVRTDVGPLGPQSLNAAGPTGAIIRYDTDSTTETVIDPSSGAQRLTLPAEWTGKRRRILQAAGSCSGPMLASDDIGGILWRDPADGFWRARANGLTGLVIRDIAYGYGSILADQRHAAALAVDSTGAGGVIYHNQSLPNDGLWSACVNLGAMSGVNGSWRAMGLAPDGRLIAATDRGETALANLGNCAAGPIPGPAFVDSQSGSPVTVKPTVNGFVFPRCYTGVSSRPAYAYTDSGIFYTPDLAAANFSRISRGLLSEEVGGLAVSPDPSCVDQRMVGGTRRGGPVWGDPNGLCHAVLKTAAAFNSLAVGTGFSVPSGGGCFNNLAPYDIYAGSANQGIFRSGSGGQEFFTAGDTRELAFRDLTSARNGTGFKLYGLSYSGVYDSDGGANFGYHFTADALLKIRGSRMLTAGEAYGISDGKLYASFAGAGWEKLVDLFNISSFACFSGAVDLAPGGRLGASKDELWIACGAGGLLEARVDAANGVSGVVHTVSGLSVRRVAASALAAASNRVMVQTYNGSLLGYAYACGIKSSVSPDGQITFTPCGSGLPVSEEALQLVAEPARNDAGTQFWALFPSQGLFRSTDAGATFTRVVGTAVAGGLPKNYIAADLALAANYNSSAGRANLALLLAGQGVYYSTDGGQSFCSGPAQVSALPSGVRAMTTGVFSNDLLFAGADAGVFVSDDRGAHWHNRTPGGPAGIAPVRALATHKLSGSAEALLVGTTNGIWRSTDYGLNWALVRSGGSITAFARDFKSCGNDVVATVAGGAILRSLDGGATWSAQAGPTDGAAADRADGGCLTLASPGGETPDAVTAPYWAAGTSSGASWSLDGASWSLANGGNDYTLPAQSGFASVRTLGGSPSQVLIGHSTGGLFRTLDGGDTWRSVSGTGSGLELTSQNASTLLTAQTAYGNTDALVGMNGTTNGGVYLSGDGGEHWTQVNEGFDPNNLSISSLVKTNCNGCPVQYYSGTYGSGVYTRTITVNNPPTFPGVNYACFGSTGCACATTGGSGPEQGGQAFKLCGTGFANGIVVEFDGARATGCTQTGGTVITCTGTPPHVPGSATVRVRNTDTRAGTLPAAYTYTAGTPRTGNTLRAAKSTADAWISWSCASCTAGSPARLYRGQNALLSLYPENYNGGASGAQTGGCTPAAGTTSCHNQTGATSSAQSYFWSVE